MGSNRQLFVCKKTGISSKTCHYNQKSSSLNSKANRCARCRCILSICADFMLSVFNRQLSLLAGFRKLWATPNQNLWTLRPPSRWLPLQRKRSLWVSVHSRHDLKTFWKSLVSHFLNPPPNCPLVSPLGRRCWAEMFRGAFRRAQAGDVRHTVSDAARLNGKSEGRRCRRRGSSSTLWTHLVQLVLLCGSGDVGGSGAERTRRSGGLHRGLDSLHATRMIFFSFCVCKTPAILNRSFAARIWLKSAELLWMRPATNNQTRVSFVSSRFPFGHLEDLKLYGWSCSFFRAYAWNSKKNIHTLKCLSGPRFPW